MCAHDTGLKPFTTHIWSEGLEERISSTFFEVFAIECNKMTYFFHEKRGTVRDRIRLTLILCLLAPRNMCCCNACFGEQVDSKYGTLSSLHSADEPQHGRSSCALLQSCFIGSCFLGVSKRLSRSISLAVYLFQSSVMYK